LPSFLAIKFTRQKKFLTQRPLSLPLFLSDYMWVLIVQESARALLRPYFKKFHFIPFAYLSTSFFYCFTRSSIDYHPSVLHGTGDVAQ
jgi:hypothetical protein